jgi:hypothetical protein
MRSMQEDSPFGSADSTGNGGASTAVLERDPAEARQERLRAAVAGRPDPRVKSPPSIIALLIGGVIMPLVVLAIEWATRQCANTFFDPLPTWLHVLAVALVPTSNLLVALTLTNRAVHRLKWLVPLQGAAIGIAAAYAIVFLPLLPLAFFALFIVGWGLLPMTPLISLIFSIRGYYKLRTIAHEDHAPMPRVWPAMVAAVVVLAFPTVHSALTLRVAALATSDDPAVRSRGLALTRAFGSEDALLRHSYGNMGRINIMREWGLRRDGALKPEDARTIYYQVTGKPFNSVPAPSGAALGGQRGANAWNFDAALGGTQVANRVPGLSMISSRLDAKADAAAATSYMEWTMVFRNVAANASEARAQIELPEGAAVSRLTLWIDGVPQEAAFGGRAQVRAAYQEVAVVQRRDPVLVTTAGPNRILMQCFPVPRHGGEMKVRLGITAPLKTLDAERSEFALPRMLEWNFEYGPGGKHDLWLESDGPIVSKGGTTGSNNLKRQLSEAEMKNAAGIAIRRPASGEVWTEDPTDPTFAIRQVVRERPVTPPARIVFLIDGSVSTRPHLDAIATQAIRDGCPPGMQFAMIFAGDQVETPWEGFQSATPEALKSAASWLKRRKAVGGRENMAAILQAWDLASAAPDSAIVWVHGTQPLLSGTAEPLLQRRERAKFEPFLYDLCVETGPNRLLENLDGYSKLRVVRFGGTPAEDLRSQMTLWNGAGQEWFTERQRVPRPTAFDTLSKADKHVARLWAAEEVERLRFTPEQGSLDRAVKLAIEMQLVTPVSGAVVLERAEQYARHGLQQGAPGDSPTVPEPGTAALLACAAAAYLGGRRFRDRQV